MQENPYLTILKGVFPKDFNFSIHKVFYIKGFELNTQSLELITRESFDKENFIDKLEELKYNSQSNNINLYYIESNEGKGVLYFITDPLELYEAEQILRIVEFKVDERIKSFSTFERIN